MVNCCSTLFLCEWSARGKGDLWCMFAPGGTVRFGNRFTISAYLCALLWNVTQLLSLALHKLRNEKGGKNMETGVFSAHHSFFYYLLYFFSFMIMMWSVDSVVWQSMWQYESCFTIWHQEEGSTKGLSGRAPLFEKWLLGGGRPSLVNGC